MNSNKITGFFVTPLALCFAANSLVAGTFGDFTYTDNNDSAVSISGFSKDATGDVVIPTKIHDKFVTVIGELAFFGCTGIDSVTIPKSVFRIDERAFFGCSSLKSIKIPAKVTSIEFQTFHGCALESVTLPDNITRIGEDAFYGCAISSIWFPTGLTSIGSGAFSACNKLTNATFLGNAPIMGNGVFEQVANEFSVNYFSDRVGFDSPKWEGYPASPVDSASEIAVQHPNGSRLVDGDSRVSFGTVIVGNRGKTKTFTIKNTGTAKLNDLAVTIDGVHKLDYIVTDPGKKSLPPGTSTKFTVTFSPTVVRATQNNFARVHIYSDDSDENSFDIQLTGLGVAP